ncbi:NhaP-type Na+/H+ or K+/H+ antiporter [Palleronia marisminoris]|uniref:K(+)/H(+) antiporter NhaP2 n=1 Tax=Palleronia marisminoris TaxID=315423 RepID=A0A1Y5SFJ7_9RHOB|nr:cation:proton antiporter [Palleronia marisminoris]SFG71508.1 NhaP-type Na+/H+ or K+/H+ antiporter [Palleronia marisminoris]SLN36508.1 K(+)/H(+) antiporter NhaP2 [Palleronia marisminoris]
MEDARFGFDAYHILLVALGGSLLVSYWLPHLFFRRAPAATALLMVCGMTGSLLFPDVVAGIDPTEHPEIWELAAEIVVIVVLFATGLRIDDLGGLRLWRPTVRLLAITMPLTIAAVALLGWSVAGMTVGGAILLGAVLAPTDPVLAGDLQIGPPLEGKEHPVRFALTTEAGLNDGLAFPFVYLALHVASAGTDPSVWLVEWITWDVLYRITVGTVLGAAIGWVLGRILIAVPAWNQVAAAGPGILVLAGVFLAYGIVELAEGYGFIAAFVAGLVCRRAEAKHKFHQRLHSFASSVENAITAILLVLLGSVMPSLWTHLDWGHTIIGFGLILVIRPLAGMIGLVGTELGLRARSVVALYGVRGIGSLYYLGYASTHVEFIDEGPLWALVAFTIFASTVIHGLTATATVEVLDREYAEAGPTEGESRS